MTVIFKSKIPPWADVFPQIEEIVANQTDTPFCVSIPYGLQLQKHIWNPERLRVVRHVNNASGHSFISHHGVGKKNEINIWNCSKEKQPKNSANGFKSISTDLTFLHILFAPRRWVYVTYCNDLSMRTFSAKFHILSTTSVNKTILSLAYNEIRDEIITGIAGGIMTWKFPIGQTDPLIPGQLISCSFTPFDWVMSLTVDNGSRQILAISDVRISMIDLHTHRERCFFQKKCDFSFTTCVLYTPTSYFITGDKNGSIRAWSMSLNSFPMVTQFLGHTSEITKLLVHPEEPLLVSGSLDKTIRIWNFDTCAQTFKLETGEDIIDMDLLSADLLYYHSHHHVKIWSLNLFHSLFTALSSRIRRWTRVKSPGYPSRVLVHAEDGGVRLVSPVHGYELTTLLPITTMTTDIVDVAHDPRQEKIYLVLGTREVLVFESDTNPCCAHQLWVPESPDEGVCSLALVNAEFALHANEIPLKSGLLFAGHYNGQISLVSGKDAYMKENIQAHHGQVTFLRVSTSCTESHDSLASHDHLISYGTDRTVKIWQLIHPEKNRVSIQQVALVKLLQPPRDLAMAGNTLCMAMADNNVVMCRVEADNKGKTNIFNSAKKSHEFLMHSKDEGHSAPINGLSCCSTLGLFATSSEDQCVKIWNTDNQLVREMCFDESLCGVCFANSRGDVLVGFQSHISLVTILNYLPPPYLEILSKMNFDNDPFEDHVQFDDLLKFWYDPQRVPRMPLEASKRRPLEPQEIKRPKKRKKKEPVIEKAKPEEGEEMDLFQKRRASRRLSTQVHVMMALRRFSTKTSKNELKKIMNAIQKGEEKPTDMEDSQGGQIPVTLPGEKEITKVYWPCAPDGFIPNSVVRNLVKPRKLPEKLIPRIKRPERKKVEVIEEEEDDEETERRITDFWTLWKTFQTAHVKEKLQEESSKKKDGDTPQTKRRRVSKRTASNLGRRLPPRPQAGKSLSEAPLMDVEEVEGEEEMEEEVEEEEEFEEIEEEEEEILDQEEEEEEEVEQEEASEESPESSPEWSPTELQESPEMSVEDSDEDETESLEEVDDFQSSTSETESVTSVMKLEITTSDTHLLTRIKRKEWYPTLEKWTLATPSVDQVLDNMLSVLPKVNSLQTMKDICEQFKNVEREFGISSEKNIEIQNQLIKLTSSEEPSTRQAAVWALGESNVHREDAYLSIVRRLIDDDKNARREAKRVLKHLTGVETKEDLCRLFINTGVVHLHLPCNDNAVLHELAERLTLRKWRKKANITVVEDDDEKATSLGDLRATMRRKPFKAKFKHPKTMKRRPRDPALRRRRPSILDEPASLTNMEKLKVTLRESTLGCKLLQNMESFRGDIIPNQSPSKEKDGKDLLEIGGSSVSSIQQADQDWLKDSDKMQINLRSSFSKEEGSFIPVTISRRFSHRGTIAPEDKVTPIVVPTASMTSMTSLAVGKPSLGKPGLAISPKDGTLKSLTKTHGRGKDSVSSGSSKQRDYKEQSTYTPPSRGSGQRSVALQPTTDPLDTSFYKRNQIPTCRERHTEFLSLTQILRIMDHSMGVNQPSAMLLLLKMKRSRRIIAKQVSLDDNKIEQCYSVGDLLEFLCNLPPLVDVLTSLARKASKSKQEIMMNMRGLFRSEVLSITQKGNYVVIDGFGRMPSEYHDTLLELRRKVFENVDRYLENDELLSSSRVNVEKSFTSLLEHLLWFCAILEPEIEVGGVSFGRSKLPSHERIHTSGMETLGLSIDTTLSQNQEIHFARKKTEEQAPPIFERPSLQHCLGPGTHGQRLLNSTLIRAKALSDSRLRTSREAQEFVVMSLPHRLSVHTGKKLEGESHFGIMELTWRAGTPLPPSNSEASQDEKNRSFPQLAGKPVELKEHYLQNKKKKGSESKIPKSQSVPPLSHRKVKPFAEKRLNLFRAVNSLNNKDSLSALSEYINNKNIIKKKFLDKNGKLLPGSFTDVPQPPNTATPVSFQASPALNCVHNDSLTSVKSGESSGRCSGFYDQARDLTRDTLLRELNKFHLPPIWRVGGHRRSP